MTRLVVGVCAVLVFAIALAGAGWKIGRDGANAKHAAMAALITETADAVEQRTATRIAAVKVVHQTINGQVREVIRENTVYRECVVDPDMQRLLSAAREGRAIAGADRSSVPAASASAAP